jgi:chromate transport protein ChrA
MSRFARREDLPFGVVVVALGFILNAVLFALAMAGIYGTSRAIVELTSGTPLLRPVYIAVLAVEVLAALLLLRRHPAGWVLAMLLICVSLAFLLATWYVGSPEYLRMAIFAAMALYLNQREVRTAFAWHPKEDVETAAEGEGAGAA